VLQGNMQARVTCGPLPTCSGVRFVRVQPPRQARALPPSSSFQLEVLRFRPHLSRSVGVYAAQSDYRGKDKQETPGWGAEIRKDRVRRDTNESSSTERRRTKPSERPSVENTGDADRNDRATAVESRKRAETKTQIGPNTVPPEEKPSTSQPDNGEASIRINKCFKEFASRRESDRFVSEGRVRINDAVALPGARVQVGDLVALDGRPVDWEHLNLLENDTSVSRTGGQTVAGESRFIYLKYWKPRGVTCTTDRNIRGNIVDAIGHPERVFMVGRLDKDSTGLILLTSDGRVPNSVNRSRENHPKTYFVTTKFPLSDDDLANLRAGVVISTVAQRDRGRAVELTAATLPCEVVRSNGSGRTGKQNCVDITLTEGRNRQIRKMMDAIENEVAELHRNQVMGITLSGLGAPGDWAELNEFEMEDLRVAINHAAESV